MEEEMEELYVAGVATHGGPESCVVVREGGGEALTGARAGRALEPRNVQSGVRAHAVAKAEGNIDGGVIARRRRTPRGQRTRASQIGLTRVGGVVVGAVGAVAAPATAGYPGAPQSGPEPSCVADDNRRWHRTRVGDPNTTDTAFAVAVLAVISPTCRRRCGRSCSRLRRCVDLDEPGTPTGTSARRRPHHSHPDRNPVARLRLLGPQNAV